MATIKRKSAVKYSHLADARRVYRDGGNVSKYLSQFEQDRVNTESNIEISYDMQAGTYIDLVLRDRPKWEAYTGELASWLGECVDADDRVMEVGCGECTTFAGIFRRVSKGAQFFAFDLSWSRVAKARQFVAQTLDADIGRRLNLFVAEISRIPIAPKSIDVVYTAHSLEPNGGREVELLQDLFRVTRRKLVLFEPYFEGASAEAQKRMTSHGYIRDLERAIVTAGGKLERKAPIQNTDSLNPTFFFEITPPAGPAAAAAEVWCCPISGYPLVQRENVFWCEASGLVYPIVGGIPVLRPDVAILATAFE